MMYRQNGIAPVLGISLLLLSLGCQGDGKKSPFKNFEPGRGSNSELAKRLEGGSLVVDDAEGGVPEMEEEIGVSFRGLDGAPMEDSAGPVVGRAELRQVAGTPGTPNAPSTGTFGFSSMGLQRFHDRDGNGLPDGQNLQGRSGRGQNGNGQTGGSQLPRSEKSLPEETVTGGGDEGDGKSGSKKASKQAWKRSKGRPSFARVYVGGGNSLELERMRITIYLDGPRARTVVDHIFKNPHDKALEGTFEYPLPAGATPSAYAMFVSDRQDRAPDFFTRMPGNEKGSESPPAFLANMAFEEGVKRVNGEDWGKLRQARVVRKKRARQVYEEITRRRIDPALLEYAGGNTFRGRVFPIPAKGYNRVILAYEETLPLGDEGLRYRFALPDCDLGLLHITVSSPVKGVREIVLEPAPGNQGEVVEGRRLQQLAWEKEKGPGGDLSIRIVPESSEALCLSGPDQSRAQGQAFLASLHPRLPMTKIGKGTPRAVFLLDTSLSESPDRFAVNRKLIQRILERNDSIKSFNVLLFDVTARWLQPGGFIDNNKKARGEALAAIDKVLLEGATDLSAALRKLAVIPWIPDAGILGKMPLDVFLLTDGQISWGERKLTQILAPVGKNNGKFRARFFCYRNGLSAENLTLFDQLTRNGGAVFNVFSEKEIDAAALAHRRPAFLIDGLQIEGVSVQDLLVAGRRAALYPGGSLQIAGRYAKEGKARVKLSGTLDGKPYVFEADLGLDGSSELAGRAWAEIAVQQMLALQDPEVDDLAVAYAQHFNIATRETSFLVLETDADYERFEIGKEATQAQIEDIARYLHEAYRKQAQKEPSRRRDYARLLDRISGETGLFDGGEAPHVKRLFETLQEKDFVLSDAKQAGSARLDVLPERDQVPEAYAGGLRKNRREPALHLVEAERRAKDGQALAALRALSNLVEIYPSRSDALRLVGYRLLSMSYPGFAAALFDQVREQRPFEPQSYRDLGRALDEAGSYGLAAIQYEILLAGTWHARFHASLQLIAREEYISLMRRTLREKKVSGELLQLFGERLEALGTSDDQADLRVTISWNTDNTDIDLWVKEPGGEACGYSHKETKNGGKLLDDLTQGYGPERYVMKKARRGVYTILVQYYSPNPNLLAGETHVEVLVTRKAGTPEEETVRYPVILRKAKEGYEVCKVRL